jgi:hypothetical protein
LLEKFSFSLPETGRISWNMGTILTPHVAGREDEPPCMPLMVGTIGK